MSFRPSCIICCSDCDVGGLFTSCQHFLCARCTARYPPGQCQRCRKPCKAVKAGSSLPKEVQERISQDPQRLLTCAAKALDFQRRQEQQTLQRLREIVTTLNQSNRSMASQLNAAKTEREDLLDTIKRLQGQLYAQQQQQQQQQQQRMTQQRPPDSQIAGDNIGAVYGAAAVAQGSSARASPFRMHAPSSFLQTNVMPSPTNAAVCGWLSFPSAGAGAVTPLGWGQSKRPRDDGRHTPTNNNISNNMTNNGNNHNGDDGGGAGSGGLTRFRLATPAITLRNGMPGMRDSTPVHQMDCSISSMSAPKQLKSLLCRGP